MRNPEVDSGKGNACRAYPAVLAAVHCSLSELLQASSCRIAATSVVGDRVQVPCRMMQLGRFCNPVRSNGSLMHMQPWDRQVAPLTVNLQRVDSRAALQGHTVRLASDAWNIFVF